MIDRLLLSITWEVLPLGYFELVTSRYNSVYELDKKTGDILWEKPRTSKCRSDDPDVNLRFTAQGFQIWGSPAVFMNNGNNVFGSCDIFACSEAVIARAAIALDVELPSPERWELDGLDLTHNYLLGDHNEVLQVLDYMKKLMPSRMKTTPYPTSVYFGQGSKLRTFKAYEKGSQIRKLELKNMKKEGFNLNLDEWQLAICYNMLRLELCLKKEFFNRMRKKLSRGWIDRDESMPKNQKVKKIEFRWEWWLMDVDELETIYDEGWEGILGNGVEVPVIERDLESSIYEAARSLGYSENQANAVYLTWASIKAFGQSTTKYRMSKRTWYRHIKVLKAAGLTSADFNMGTVQTIRITHINLGKKVESWEDVRESLKA